MNMLGVDGFYWQGGREGGSLRVVLISHKGRDFHCLPPLSSSGKANHPFDVPMDLVSQAHVGHVAGCPPWLCYSHSKARWNISMAEWTKGLVTVTWSQLMHKPIRNQLKVLFLGRHILLLVVVCWTEVAFPYTGISCTSTAQEWVYFVVLEISELYKFHSLYAPWSKDLVSNEALQKGWASADLLVFWKLTPSKIRGEPVWDHFTEAWGISDTACM